MLSDEFKQNVFFQRNYLGHVGELVSSSIERELIQDIALYNLSVLQVKDFWGW